MKEAIAKVGTTKDILGELQYCFITFLLGENLEAFEQWKSLVSILCSCPSGMQQDSTLSKDLFYPFIPVIYEQLL